MRNHSSIPLGLCQCGCGQQTKLAPRTQASAGWIKGQPLRFARSHHAKPLEQRFWDYANKSDGCWIWTGSVDRRGYGLTCVRTQTRKAHRVAYELTYGPIPEGLLVCHRCDNPPCVRPDHLFLGTAKDNMLDMKAKGRQATGTRHGTYTHPEKRPRGNKQLVRYGEANGSAKLAKEQVLEIRARFTKKHGEYSRLGRMYGISHSSVRAIVNRTTWQHI